MKLLRILLIIVIITGCGGPRKLSNRNLAFQYSPGLVFIHPDYRVYNLKTDSARVFFSIDPAELLFVHHDSTASFHSSFSISYRLLRNYESKMPLDSATFFYDYEKKDEEGVMILDHFDLRARDSSDYILEITFSDLNRQQAVTGFLDLKRSGKQDPSDFMIFDDTWNRPVVQNFTDHDMMIRIHYTGEGRSKIYMRYFRGYYPLPSPPFSSDELKPLSYVADETKLIDLETRESVPVNKHGIYHFQFDTLIKTGLTFFYFEEDFPKLTSAESLIESIRYLTTRQEFDKILTSNNKKEAVDNFWLSMAGSRERARILIKSYYTRVQQANMLFTSYVEGWKTDRGLVYIIFGPPSSVYRNQDNESWNYSQNAYYGSLSFTFDKISNPFTENDFKLRRSRYYEIPWYKAVDSWRDGRVVNENY